MKIIAALIGIFIFLTAFNPLENELEESKARGKEIYEENCITCHLGEGTGVAGTFPPLANSDFLRNNLEQSIRAVKYGQSGEIVVNGVSYNNYMAEIGLEDEEVADVINYIRNAWGNKNDTLITVEFVKGIEEE